MTSFNFFENIVFNHEIAYFIAQIIFSIFTINLFLKVIQRYYPITKFDMFALTILYFLNPVKQFIVFNASNGILTFSMLIITIYFLDTFYAKKNIYLISLFIGILFLMNRSFIVSVAVFIIFRLFKNRRNINYYFEAIFAFVIFWIPIYIYRYWIKLNGYNIDDTGVVDYGHFIWVSKYFNKGIGFWMSKGLLSEENFNLRLFKDWNSQDEWYCQNIPDNFICYFNDLLNVSIYLFLPVLIIIFYLIFSHKINNNLLKMMILTGFMTMFFWSFIGWYPPLRLGLYSYGNVIFLFILVIYSMINSFKIKITFLASLILGLLNISHWNNSNLVEITNLDLASFLMLALNFYLVIKESKKQ